MKKIFFSMFFCAAAVLSYGEQAPIFYESFDKCKNDDDLSGYTGGNDGLWGGDVAKAIVVYTDNVGWEDGDCNGANQCVKVGLKNKGGRITTPEIVCDGDLKLTFRAAPWIATDEDSTILVSVTSGELDKSSFTLKPEKWNDITLHIYEVEGSVKVTFKSNYKNRFFLDEVKVWAAEADDAYLRVSPDGFMDFGLLTSGYSQQSRELKISTNNITSAGVSVTFDNPQNAFELDQSQLTSNGGKVIVRCKTGKSAGIYDGTLTFSAVSAKDASVKLEKKIFLGYQVTETYLQGAGTKDNPFTVNDILSLWDDGTLWGGEKFWVRGYVLGAAYHNSETKFDGVTMYDEYSIVLASDANETTKSKMLPVQLEKGAARNDLNVVDNPELVGLEVSVYGEMENYLGVHGVRGVKNSDQYVRPGKDGTGWEEVIVSPTGEQMYNVLGQPVDANSQGVVIRGGRKYMQIR